jgi:hypothetical protein
MTESELALTAAIAPPQQARRAWTQLLEIQDFDGMAETTQRILPTIFFNLREFPELPHWHRLKGAYRHTWVRNEQMSHSVAEILAALEESGIDYRLTKGAAITSLTGRSGCRTMADVDIVINDADAHRAANLISEHGFRNSDLPPCPHRAPEDVSHGLNFHRGSHRLDLHLANSRHPVQLFGAMIDNPPLRVPFGGVTASIARPEFLLLHAIVHGSACFSATDRIQALVDACQLAPFVDRGRLTSSAHRLGLSGQATEFLQELALPGIDAPHTTLETPSVITRLHETSRSVTRRIVGGAPAHLQRLAQIRDRALPRGALTSTAVHSVRHPLVYRIWLGVGRFGRIEERAIRVLGGFLPRPQAVMPTRLRLAPFSSVSEYASAITDPLSVFDWRIRVHLPVAKADVVLRMHDSTLDRVDVYIFANGRYIARALAGDDAHRTVYLRSVTQDLEISIRPMNRPCATCFVDLDRMIVDLEIARVPS